MGKLLNFLSVVFGWLVWRWTGSLLFGALAAVILFPFVGPLIQGLISLIAMMVKELLLLFIPAQTVHLALPRGEGSEGRGLRVFLGRKDFAGKAPHGSLPPSDVETLTAAAKSALAQNKNFAHLDAYIVENGLPIELYTTDYKRGLCFDKAVRAWRAVTDIRRFKRQQDNINIFSCSLQAENGKLEYARAIFLFDADIPLPKEENPTPAAQKTPAQNG